MACALEMVSPFPGKNTTEVDGAHQQPTHRPGTWKRRNQLLVVFQRMSGQGPHWKRESWMYLWQGLRKLRPMTSELSILDE